MKDFVNLRRLKSITSWNWGSSTTRGYYFPNGYRLWNPDQTKIITSRDVIFNENMYPFHTIKKPSTEDLLVYRIEPEDDGNKELLEPNLQINFETSDHKEANDLQLVDVDEAEDEDLLGTTIVEENVEPTLRRSQRLKTVPNKFADFYHSLFEAYACADEELIPETY